MIFKERLPGVACFTFIFISGLIFTWSFTLADDTGNCTVNLDEDWECTNETESLPCVDVFIMNSFGVMELCHQLLFHNPEENNQNLLSTLRDFNADKMICILDMKKSLSCYWNISGLPKNAAYSANVTIDHLNQNLKCSHVVEKEALDCHGPIDVELNDLKTIVVNVSISLPTLRYITATVFKSLSIVKLHPPHNIFSTISNNLKNLEINWTLGDWTVSQNHKCYEYELKINDEVVPLADGVSSFIKQDVDLTRKYSIKVRVKLSEGCGGGVHWSEWSPVYEVGPSENKYSVNPWVITVIVLILPMFLLAILLLCKFQRLPKKLFPPIPGPSINVKNLLEKEHDFQDFSSRYVEHETEIVYANEERNC